MGQNPGSGSKFNVFGSTTLVLMFQAGITKGLDPHSYFRPNTDPYKENTGQRDRKEEKRSRVMEKRRRDNRRKG